MDYTSTINWDGKAKLCKVYCKQDKKGNTYFMGDLNKSVKLIIQEVTGQYAKDGEWQVCIVPVTWKKADGADNKPAFKSAKPTTPAKSSPVEGFTQVDVEEGDALPF